MSTQTRVFITGASGFLGQAVCRCLIDAGLEVIRYSLSSRTYDTSLPGKFIFGDTFSQQDLVSALEQTRPDFIIHLASAGVLEGDNCPQSLYEINVQATVNLFEAAAVVGGCKVIHTGSCSEYACSDDMVLIESSPISPPNYYGATKAASVQLGLGLARLRSVPAVVLRPFNLYGPGESPKRLIPYLIQQQLSGRECQLTHGLQQKDFLFIEDAANGYLKAIDNFENLRPYGIYNLCTGVPSSLRAIGERIVHLMQGDMNLYRWGAKQARAGEPQFIVGSPQRFINDSSWFPATEIDIGLEKTINYYRRETIRELDFPCPMRAAAA